MKRCSDIFPVCNKKKKSAYINPPQLYLYSRWQNHASSKLEPKQCPQQRGGEATLPGPREIGAGAGGEHSMALTRSRQNERPSPVNFGPSPTPLLTSFALPAEPQPPPPPASRLLPPTPTPSPSPELDPLVRSVLMVPTAPLPTTGHKDILELARSRGIF
jgi:hypothetical protein